MREVTTALEASYLGINIAGPKTPPFALSSMMRWTNLPSASGHPVPRLVWIGLGTPRQNYLAPRLADRLEAAIIPVGAAYDFVAGRVGEAPEILQGHGLAWLRRLYGEPRRLWRRCPVGLGSS